MCQVYAKTYYSRKRKLYIKHSDANPRRLGRDCSHPRVEDTDDAVSPLYLTSPPGGGRSLALPTGSQS